MRTSSWINRRRQDKAAQQGFFLITLLPGLIFLAITVMLALRSRPLLAIQTPWQLLSGAEWQPLQGKFGFLPFIAGTFWVTCVAMALAVPPCLLTAIYLTEYARPATWAMMKPLLDLLAAIPSVVYGVWGILTIVPLVQKLHPAKDSLLGSIPLLAPQNPTGYSLLAGGIVLAVMIVPFIVAVICEVMSAVPEGFRQAALALGATRWQMVKSAVLPQVLPGIIAGMVLGASRALGETMAVLMVVGNIPKAPTSLFDPAYPLPALIANNYGEMMSIPLYDAALLGAAFILLLIVLVFNVFSTLILRQFIQRSTI